MKVKFLFCLVTHGPDQFDFDATLAQKYVIIYADNEYDHQKTVRRPEPPTYMWGGRQKPKFLLGLVGRL